MINNTFACLLETLHSRCMLSRYRVSPNCFAEVTCSLEVLR